MNRYSPPSPYQIHQPFQWFPPLWSPKLDAFQWQGSRGINDEGFRQVLDSGLVEKRFLACGGGF